MCKDQLFGNAPCFGDRFISDTEHLKNLISTLKKEGKKIVLTSGSWDLLHIGHAQYLMRAKEKGDVLIVGVDDDEKVKQRKGPNRPIVPQEERFKMLSHLRYVDVIVPKPKGLHKFSLLKLVKPDVLVISETTKHSEDKIREMESYCGRIELLPPQSTTSTSAKVRLLFTQGVHKFGEEAKKAIDKLIKDLTQ